MFFSPSVIGVKCETDCPYGFYGDDCTTKCDCSDHGSCDKKIGTCNCERGWQGAFCNQPCNTGYYGQQCKEKCPNTGFGKYNLIPLQSRCNHLKTINSSILFHFQAIEHATMSLENSNVVQDTPEQCANNLAHWTTTDKIVLNDVTVKMEAIVITKLVSSIETH